MTKKTDPKVMFEEIADIRYRYGTVARPVTEIESAEWKLPIKVEFTARDTPQQNSLTKVDTTRGPIIVIMFQYA
jgi:hypothetical protein